MYYTYTTPIRKRIFTKAYLRWKEQLEALKADKLNTVRRLAKEASDHLELKRQHKVQLSIV